jgi:hypothetical protein
MFTDGYELSMAGCCRGTGRGRSDDDELFAADVGDDLQAFAGRAAAPARRGPHRPVRQGYQTR